MMSDTQMPSEKTKTFCSWLVDILDQTIKQSLTKKGIIKREVLWPKLHNLQCSSSFRQIWKTYLESINAPTDAIFFQHLTRTVFEDLLKKKCIPEESAAESQNEEFTPLTSEDENAVNYVGGYIVRTLRNHESDAELLHGLKHLETSDEETTEAATWTKTISRGGLTFISKGAQQCFVAIEEAVRRYLVLDNVHTMDETFRERLNKLIFANDDVQFYWCLTGVANLIGNDRADELLEMCINKWVTIRGFSFADSTKELFKQETKQGISKAKALRKTLF